MMVRVPLLTVRLVLPVAVGQVGESGDNGVGSNGAGGRCGAGIGGGDVVAVLEAGDGTSQGRIALAIFSGVRSQQLMAVTAQRGQRRRSGFRHLK